MSLALALTLITVAIVGCWAAWASWRSFQADDLGQMPDDWSPRI